LSKKPKFLIPVCYQLTSGREHLNDLPSSHGTAHD